jgi:hypothetical protein
MITERLRIETERLRRLKGQDRVYRRKDKAKMALIIVIRELKLPV